MAFAEFVTLAWASGWAWNVVTRLRQGDRNSLLVIYLVFYFEYAMPLGLDLVFGLPDYSGQPGFSISDRDPYVHFLYCVFVVSVPILWLWRSKSHSRTSHAQSPAWARLMLRVACFLPLYLIPLAPEPGVYLQYAGIVGTNAPIGVLAFHIVVSMATMIAVLCVAFRCLTEPLSRRNVVENVLAILISAWINGKRYIVAESLVLVILALWYRGAIAGKKLLWTAAGAVLILGVFSVTYQENIRHISFMGASQNAAKQDARVDYTRDSRVKMALYADLYPEKMQILSYPGQNLLYYATLVVPRTLWSDKPLPYSAYFTSAMLNMYPRDIKWGMTTGLFDETISNTGLMGILLGPLLLRWFCAVGDSVAGWGIHILTCILGCLLMSVQLAAFTPLVLLWVIIVMKNKRVALWSSAGAYRRRPAVVA